MIADITTTAQPLIPVATGKAANGTPYTVAVSPDYLAYQDRLRGAELYRRCQPIEVCENADQHQGWIDEQDWYVGQAQFVRALELEDCPASWADPYQRTDAWFDRQWEPPF